MNLYTYRGCITDSKENWLHFIGDTEFYRMLKTGELTEIRTS